jgi:tetraacyldisaccharide-1-P 4'-kinase
MRLAAAERPGRGEPYAVVSGVARPGAFEAGCARLIGWPACLTVRCDDHAAYSAATVSRLLAAGRQHGVAVWLTTEKDAVKLRPLWPAPESLRVVRLEVAWAGKETLPDLVEERLRALPAAR